MPPRPADITFYAMNNPNLCNRKHELSQTTANLLTLIAFSCNQARLSIFHANLTRQALKGEEARKWRQPPACLDEMGLQKQTNYYEEDVSTCMTWRSFFLGSLFVCGEDFALASAARAKTAAEIMRTVWCVRAE
jgi:hypothetical protein